MKVKEPVRQKWTRFHGIAEGGQRFKVDVNVRPLFTHVAREIQRPFLQRTGTGSNVVEEVPPELQEEYGAAIADHLIVELGGPGKVSIEEDSRGETKEIERNHGLEVDMTEDGLLVAPTIAANYGVPTLTPGMDGGAISEQPWPMSPEGKYALISIFTELSKHVQAFAKEIAAPIDTTTPERQEQDDENLDSTPSSEPSSPSETASPEQ